MTLAEKLLSLRTERELSQEDLAERLEVSRQSVSKWETGQSVPDLDKIIRLADLFGVTVDELVREGERPRPPEPSQSQVVYVERGREKREWTAVQKIGLVWEAAGVVFAVTGLMYEERAMVYKALLLLLLGLPLFLTKKHPRLTLCWVLMGLSLMIFDPHATAWWIPDGLAYLRFYFSMGDPKYSSYLFGGIVGLIRGLLLLVLIFFTGRPCWRSWKNRTLSEEDG